MPLVLNYQQLAGTNADYLGPHLTGKVSLLNGGARSSHRSGVMKIALGEVCHYLAASHVHLGHEMLAIDVVGDDRRVVQVLRRPQAIHSGVISQEPGMSSGRCRPARLPLGHR